MDSMASEKKILKRASPSTIQDKFLVGYQGWFSCSGDGEPIHPGHSGWLHWFNGDRPNLDVWPDVSSYSPSELFPARDMKLRTGEQAFLFSSRHPKTVQRHFHWMAEHGIDGAFLQRFVEQCQPGQENSIRKLRDEVGQLVRESAEKEGRVFAIMYDVSSVPADQIQHILERDWTHLIRNIGVLDSPNYLREKGRPVIGLWGCGFHNRGHTPDIVRSIIKFFRAVTPGGAYIFGGAPSCWRLSEGDAERHPEFVDVWLNEFDAISPWTVGRYRNEAEADKFAELKMKGDMELIKRRNEETGRKVDYVPVVHPGGSGFNLSKGSWAFNDAPRLGGRFLWKQISNAKRLGVRSLYGAMWDEYDEGTAFMPIVTHKRNLPQSDAYPFMALDEEGYDLPSDWYMRICGMAAEGLRSERWIHETFPLKELQDYWSSRPKYEETVMYARESVAGPSSSAGKVKAEVTGSGQEAYQQWLTVQNDDKDEPPPPPYTLLAEESSSTSTNVANAQIQQEAGGPPSVIPALSASHSSSGSPAAAPVPQISSAGELIPSALPASSAHYATPSVVAISERPPSDIGPTLPSTVQNLPSTSQLTPPLASTSHTSYFQEQPNMNVPVDHSIPFTGSNSPKPPSPSPTPGGFQNHQQQRPQQPSDPVLSLASDFARTSVTAQPAGSPTEGSNVVDPDAAATPTATGARFDAVSPPPLHPARLAANKPVSHGKLPATPPQGTTPQSYKPYRPNPAPPSPAQASGPWSGADWPPKEWGVSAGSSPAPNDGANLGRLQTFSGASSVNSGGANLRPSATISGPPPLPTHSRPNTKPNTAGGGGSPRPAAHVPTTSPFHQHQHQPQPTHSRPNTAGGGGSPRPAAHVPTTSPFHQPQPQLIHSRPNTAGGGGSPRPATHAPTANPFHQPQPQPQSSVSEYPPAGFPEVQPLHGTHSPSPPLGGYDSAPWPAALHSPHAPSSPSHADYGSPYHSGPTTPHITHTPSPPSPGGYGPSYYHPASSPYYDASHYYPHQPQDHNIGGFMPSAPSAYHHPSFPQPSMPTPWAPTGPTMPVGPMGQVGPMGPIGPNSMHTGPFHTPQSGPQYVYVAQRDSGGTSNSALNYALSAVDMVAGKKTRDQLQGLAHKFLK